MAHADYECMLLFNANAYARNPAAAAAAAEDAVGAVDGEIKVSRLWNEQKLAFPIKGQRKGVYWLVYFSAETTLLPKLNRVCQLNDMILRHLVIKLDPRLVEPMIAIAKGEVVPGLGGDVLTSDDVDDEEEDGEEESIEPEILAS